MVDYRRHIFQVCERLRHVGIRFCSVWPQKVKGESADESSRKEDHSITAQQNGFPKMAWGSQPVRKRALCCENQGSHLTVSAKETKDQRSDFTRRHLSYHITEQESPFKKVQNTSKENLQMHSSDNDMKNKWWLSLHFFSKQTVHPTSSQQWDWLIQISFRSRPPLI